MNKNDGLKILGTLNSRGIRVIVGTDGEITLEGKKKSITSKLLRLVGKYKDIIVQNLKRPHWWTDDLTDEEHLSSDDFMGYRDPCGPNCPPESRYFKPDPSSRGYSQSYCGIC
jgi:hypothetical protein